MVPTSYYKKIFQPTYNAGKYMSQSAGGYSFAVNFFVVGCRFQNSLCHICRNKWSLKYLVVGVTVGLDTNRAYFNNLLPILDDLDSSCLLVEHPVSLCNSAIFDSVLQIHNQIEYRTQLPS